jgi:hypothetical protein
MLAVVQLLWLISAPPAAAELTLDVLLVNDPDFPQVTFDQAANILGEAGRTITGKLGYGGVSFNIVGSTSIAELMSSAPGAACLDELSKYRARPGVKVDVPKDVIDRFLRRWKIEELRAFFPEETRAKLATYEDIAAALAAEHERKLAMIAGFKLKNGKSLLDADSLEQRSYVRWICAIREQDRADLILTNAFLLYDLASEPFPHSIYAKNKVGGASLASPKRRAIRGRAVVASTFSMVTDIPFFLEEGAAELGPTDRDKVIGTFIVAHELGHAVFKLPDFYDHPRECLMTTKYETGYVSGWRDLLQHPGSCASCQPYVEARRQVFLADAARVRDDHNESARLLKEAIRLTPKHIDGNYLRYIAALTVEVAEQYLAAGNLEQARRWYKSAQRVAPDMPEVVEFAAKLPAEP